MSACYHFTIIMSSKIYFSITRLPATFHIVGYIMSEIDVNKPKDFMNLDPVRIDCVNSTPRYIVVRSDHNYATALVKNVAFQVLARLCSFC